MEILKAFPAVVFALPLLAFSLQGRGMPIRPSGPVYSDASAPVVVSVGDSFNLSVPASPESGCTWRLSRPPDPKILKSYDWNYYPIRGGGQGATDDMVWQFEAVGAGSTTVALTQVSPGGKSPAKTVTFTIRSVQGGKTVTDDSRPISIRKGENFTILLDSNPTTGFQWSLPSPPDGKVVRLVANQFIPPESQLAGAGGKERWIFSAVGRGRTSITLIYSRSWEKGTPPALTRTYIVNVK